MEEINYRKSNKFLQRYRFDLNPQKKMAGNLAESFVLVYILLFMLGIEQKQTDFERFQSWLTNV